VPDVVDRLTVRAALDLVAGGAEVGPLVGRPLLVVTLDGADPADLGRLDGLVAHLPCVVAGVAEGPVPGAGGGLDVLLSGADEDPGRPWRWCPGGPEGLDAAVADLAAAVERSPGAAVVLVQLLRLGRDRSLDEALTAESLAYATLQAGPEHRAWLASRPSPSPDTRAGAGGAADADAVAPGVPGVSGVSDALGVPHAPGVPGVSGVSGVPDAVADASGVPDAVAVDRTGDTLWVTLRRPHVRNAVDTVVRDGLVAAFGLAAADPSIARVEWRGEGPDFCSGGDLGEFGTTPDPATAHLVRSTRSPARVLARATATARVEARVQGACIGAGVELAALAHHVVADPGARFRLPELAMGLVPGAGGTATIPRRIGPQLTAWMALTGTAVDAATAHRWGLADEIVALDPD
jgi:enoyl-CoA hydratase/carnithine racemase